MTSQNEPVEIDVAEVRAHQRQLADVLNAVRTASEAADTPVTRDAFGAFGFFHADECAAAVSNGAEMLLAAQEAAEHHHQQVGIWAQDVDATESDIKKLFSTGPVMRDA